MSHVRTTLRSYRVRNPSEFPLLVRRLADDHRSGEQFLSDRLGVVSGFSSLLSDLLRPREPEIHDTIVRHRLLDELIRYLSSHLSSRQPDSELMPLERLAERIRETRLLPGIELREATEETILDLTESLFYYYDLLSPEEEVEMGLGDVGVEEEEKVKRTRLLDEISRLIKRRPELPSERLSKRSRRMYGSLDDSL
jgi:hypothetical protein